ncbi:MAG: PilX N-terminal domain-containing pilus assembly protein [Candidatus Binatia bacterium]
MKRLGNERGFVLVISLLILALLIAAGLGAIVSTQTDLKISSNIKTATQAFYIAEAGLHRALRNLNKVNNWIGGLSDTSNAFSGENTLGSGTYVVQVFENDPTPGSVKTISTGNITGTNSSSTVEAVLTPQFYPVLNYATFNCGNLELEGGVNDVISGGDVFVGGNIELESSNHIQNGNAFATGKIEIKGASGITGGNASANGNIELDSSAVPNVGGNATAGGNISGAGTVTGTTSQNVSPDPVTDQCVGTNLANIAITSDVIQNFRSNATTTINGNYDPGSNITLTGIVHITGNFELSTAATFSGNVVFIVDGNAEIAGSVTSNPPGSTVTFLVPTGNFEVEGGGNFTIDGVLHVGTVDPDGSNRTGGNVEVDGGSSLTVNGSVIAVDGNTEADSGGGFTVNYQPPTDPNLIKPGTYTITRWREVIT